MKKEEKIGFLRAFGHLANNKIIDAFFKVKRENFVLKEYGSLAYKDIALPIMCEQTISQPSTVVAMLDLLELKKGQKVLEIGTGSGYNAALISEIIRPGKVYTVEIIKEVYEFAKKNLENYKNVFIFNTDGSLGLKQYAPYDAIIATAACPDIPYKLADQLKENGILVAPVGEHYQDMVKLTKTNNGYNISNYGKFEFVKLRGEYGFK